MQKFDLNKIINGKQRTPIKMTIKTIHKSVITHMPVIIGRDVTLATGVQLHSSLRVSLPTSVVRHLRLTNGNRISLDGVIAHNHYCLWVCDPRHTNKYTNKFLMLDMQKYILKHDEKAKQDFRKRHK